MLGQWCEAGLQYERFWGLTVAEIMLVMKSERKHRQREHDEARSRAYELAHWISFAHHEPNKMPRFETGDEREKSDALAQEQVRGFFVAMALSSGKS